MSGERKDRLAATRRLRAALLTSSALALAWTLPVAPACAQDATWRTSPTTAAYEDGINWSTGNVPSGTAYFGTSNFLYLTVGSSTSVGGWTFNAGASNLQIQNNSSGLTFTGAGITINGGSLYLITGTGATTTFQNSSSLGTAKSNNQGLMVFANSSTAGNATLGNGSTLIFQDTSTAGNAAISNNLVMSFAGSSTAGSAAITNYSLLDFNGTSTAGNANLTTESGGYTNFNDNSTAGNATLTVNSGGLLRFYGNSTTGNAAIINNAGGNIYFSGTGPAGDRKLSVQSLTGAGTSYLDFIELTLGSNNQSSEVSGTITGTGSLVKAGTGTLTLSGGDSYVGGTTITGGTLQIGTAAQTGAIIGTVDVQTGTSLSLINSNGNGMAVTAQVGGTVDFSNSAGPAGDDKQTVGSIAGAGSYLLGANELTVGSKNTSTEVSGVISGTGGSLVKIGTGTLTLTAANTYTGGTTVDEGTLQLGTLARAGSVVGAIGVGAGGALSIVNTGAIPGITNAGLTTYSNGMSAGSTAITNSGTLEFVDTATAGSAQITSTGTVNFRNTSSAGNATLTINSGTANFYDTSTAGSATIANSGTLNFRNGSTAASATINNSGTLNFGAFASSDTSTAANAIINNSGSLNFLSYSSAGSATINNSGNLGFGYASTADNATITNTSATALTAFGTVGPAGDSTSSVGAIAGAGTFALRFGTLKVGGNNTSTVVSGTLSIDGTLEKVGTGTLTLTGTNTYSGDTIVSSGRLQFGDGSAGGSNNLGGNVNVTGGTLAIETPATLNVAQTVTLGNNTTLSVAAGTTGPALSANSVAIGNGVSFNLSGISNASQLDKVLIDTQSGISGDFATVTVGGFSGTVDYLTVFTRKSADGLQYLASYGLSWTAGNSLAHGTFTLTNATDTFTLGVALTDQAANPATGWDGKSLTKAGDGTLILTGQNTYSGGTTISGGTLQLGNSGLTGSILGTVNVGAGGTFEIVNADMSGITGIANSGTTNFRNGNNAGSVNISNTGTFSFYDTSTAGTSTITNSGRMEFRDHSTAGSASITNATASNIYFFNNASAGSTTITNNGGGLVFNNSSTAGSANIANNDWSAILFNDTSSAGSATISSASRSSLGFLNSSTAGSATITNNGDMSFSNASTAGSATINNTSDYMHAQYAYLNFYDSSTAGSATINNAISSTINFHDTSTAGSATITNVSPGFLNFLNSSTAGNATITNSGSIDFWNSSSAGSATIDNLGSIAFFDSASAGSAHITGGGIGFLNTSTAGNATIINSSGGVSFVNSSTAGNATIVNNLYQSVGFHDSSTAGSATITNNGSMQFSNQATGGHATITNASTIWFVDTSTADNATIVNYGSTSFRDTSTAGSATITNNLWLTFTNQATAGSAAITNSSNVLFSGTTNAGNAQLINSTSGAVVDFSSTSGANGDHKLTAGSLAGSGTFSLGGNQLTVGSNDLSTNVTGVIADGGSAGGTGASLVKVGTGRLTLSGVNTYTGATTVDGGALAVNGDITASSGITVNSGGILGGTGIVGNTTIASGGALAPGNSIGTLTVSGNLTFSAGSFYTVEVSTTAADRTNVSGTATLTGATVQAVAIPGRFRSETYTILTATGGLSGTFAGITGSTFAPGARNPHLTYDLNNVYLVLDAGTIILPSGSSGNQIGVAGGINKAVEGGATPPAGFDVLLNMTDAQLARALNQVSGQPGAASTQVAFHAMQQFVNALDPLGAGADGERGMSGGTTDGGTLGYAATAQDDARMREAFAAVTPRDAGGEAIDRRWGVWASGYGGGSSLSGNAAAGSSSTTSRIYGTVVGADYRVSPDTLVGFALGGAGFNFSVADALGGGRADVFQAGLYARHNFGPAYLSAALAYGWQDVTTDRTVTVSGTDRLTANFKASTFAGRLETGWRFAPIPAFSFGVTPYAAVQATTFHLPGYGETALVGTNQFALSYNAQDTTNVRTELGARTDQRFLVENGVLTLRSRLAWAHDTNTNRLVNAAFQMLPGAAFTVSGARPAADSALVGGRAEMKWRNGLSLAGTIDGEFSRSTQTYTGKGTVRFEW
ncbi:autotransporter-associated beta strand protein [Bradyrhizobium japonicum USDA 38]|uniref:autotransporter-associated beta strand repeat-containing protein n=1 Tax=Bradyrhizobium japonicum TaxID=375 RepID=UPI0006769880|nr:autotransporter-associated beta strand repeat-containing protein [Bradyrhizobium japonicum]MCS3897205.1 autotransporter-associated beta strand protein [Bradyrhizobium japonicum USDA 38]MCS3949720.1 autotransporter-associated beta strand protein [Bradyrhizobium japonicum]